MIEGCRYRYPRRAWRVPGGALSLGLLCILPALVGAGLGIAGWLPSDPASRVGLPGAPVSVAHWLGTDALGRDLFSRLAAASANFVLPGSVAAGVALLVGAVLGVVGGFGGPVAAAVALWALQVLDAVPKLVLVLLVAAIARSELVWIMATVGLTFAPQIADAIRHSIQRLKATTFVEAERSLGATLTRIIFVHILWGHARRLVLGQVVSLLAYALLVETSLSYLGGEFGVQEPAASWGNMIALARDGVFQGRWLPALLPAACISVTLLGYSLVGHAVLAHTEDRT